MREVRVYVDGKAVAHKGKQELCKRRAWYPMWLVRLFPRRLGFYVPYVELAEIPLAGSHVVAMYNIGEEADA